jgi:long-chain acyl-CoA synthetase
MKTLLDLFKLFEKRNKDVFIYRTGIRRFVYTYLDLYLMSLKMASYLLEQGIKQGDKVAIWAPNSPFWGISYFGIILSGAIVIPIDYASGKRRAETILKLSGARFVIQSIYKFERISLNGQIKTVMLEDLVFLLKSQRPLEKLPVVKPSDILEIVYTSGTTGDPKGVVLTHENVVSDVLGACNHISIPKNFNFLSILPLSHMLEQTTGLLIPLYRGDKVIYLRTIKPSSIMEALKKEDIATMLVVPKFLLLLKNTIEREFSNRGLKNFSTSRLLRRIAAPLVRRKFGKNFIGFLTGGANLPLDLFMFWKEMGIRVVEGYGLTETSPIIFANTLNEQVPGSAGRAFKGLQAKLDNQELLVKGDMVFSGYYQNPEKTKEAFKNGWFKTGDYADIDRQGNIFIKGRKKDVIVNASGINIYPDEVDAVVNRINGVKDSCVIGIDRGEGEEVHAVILLKNKSADVHKIIQSANEILDPLQRIEDFSVWDEIDFPRTMTLKVQKFKVKQKILNQDKQIKTNSIKDPLISLLANVSRKNEGVIKENSVLTYDLGLNSLSRLELVNYLEQEFRVDLEDTMINQNTTVSDLRKLLDKKRKTKKQRGLWLWLNNPVGRLMREMVDNLFQKYTSNLFFDLENYGLTNLKNIKSPVIFIANHVSYLDQLAIMYSLPRRIRYKIATAARKEFFFSEKGTPLFNKIIFPYAMIAFNVFLLPQKSGFRKSLSFMGDLIDHGVSILVFPEGTRTKNGELQDFMAGLGLMVKEFQVPVVPIRILGMEKILPRGARIPKKGKCQVVFGKPIEFTTESPSEILRISRNGIAQLTPIKSGLTAN